MLTITRTASLKNIIYLYDPKENKMLELFTHVLWYWSNESEQNSGLKLLVPKISSIIKKDKREIDCLLPRDAEEKIAVYNLAYSLKEHSFSCQPQNPTEFLKLVLLEWAKILPHYNSQHYKFITLIQVILPYEKEDYCLSSKSPEKMVIHHVHAGEATQTTLTDLDQSIVVTNYFRGKITAEAATEAAQRNLDAFYFHRDDSLFESQSEYVKSSYRTTIFPSPTPNPAATSFGQFSPPPSRQVMQQDQDKNAAVDLAPKKS